MDANETESAVLEGDVSHNEEVASDEHADAVSPDSNDIWLSDTPNELIPKMGELPVSSTAYYQQLIMTEAAGSGGGSGPLDKRISPLASDKAPAMHLPSIGVLLTFEQGWFQEGLALGELRKSLCLAPGEVTKVAVVDWRRQTSSREQSATTQSEALAAQTDDASAAVTVQQSMLNETRSNSAFVMGASSHHQAGASGGIPLIFSSSGSVSNSSFMGFSATSSSGERDISTQASKNIQRRTQQLSQSARTARATQIREVSEEEAQSTTTRVVANYNHAHAQTMQYYEVLQIYRLQTRAIRADRCIFVPIKPLVFDEQSMIAASEPTLELLRQVLQDFGATELDDMVAEFQRKQPVFKELRKLAEEAISLRARVSVAERRKLEAPRVWAVETELADGRQSLIRSTTSTNDAPVHSDETAAPAQRLEGTYEDFPHNPGIKNDWHYVNITVVDETTLKWTNRANVSWTLKLTDDKNLLEVGADCPYYSKGYTSAQVEWDAYGNVKHIQGPGNGIYLHKENRIRRLVGTYENFPERANIKNDWHYVDLAAAEDGTLLWTNRAGVVWNLSLTGDDNTLAVAANCPYFAGGYTTARVGFDLLGNVTHIVGPGNSPYVNERTANMLPPEWEEQIVTVVPALLPAPADAAAAPMVPLIDQEAAWQRDTQALTTYISQGPSRGRVWDQWSWYMVDTQGPGNEPTAVTESDLVTVDMWRNRVSYGNGSADAKIIAQFQSEAEHQAWLADKLRLAKVERRYGIDRKELDAFGRLFGLLDDVGLFLNQQMWMRTDDHTWRGLLTGRTFPHGEYEGQDIGGMVNPKPLGFFGNYLAFLWDFPQDRPGESIYQDQAKAFNAVFIDSDEVSQAKTTDHATIALPTEGIFAEAVLGQSNSAEKIDMTRFWNWQESPIPILPPEMAPVTSDSRARDVAAPTPLRLAEALVALRTAGVDKALVDDDAILKILSESLDNGDSAALLAKAVTAATTASDNASAGAGSAGQASVDVSKQIQEFIVDLANSEAARIATDAALAYATGGASKMGGLLNKASKGANKARLRGGGGNNQAIPGSSDEGDNQSNTGKGESSDETDDGDPSDDDPDSLSNQNEANSALSVYEQKWNDYLKNTTRKRTDIEDVELLLAMFVSACSFFDDNLQTLKPMVDGTLDSETQAMVDVVNRAEDSHKQLIALFERYTVDDRKRVNEASTKDAKQSLQEEAIQNERTDQKLLANLDDVLFDMRLLITGTVVQT